MQIQSSGSRYQSQTSAASAPPDSRPRMRIARRMLQSLLSYNLQSDGVADQPSYIHASKCHRPPNAVRINLSAISSHLYLWKGVWGTSILRGRDVYANCRSRASDIDRHATRRPGPYLGCHLECRDRITGARELSVASEHYGESGGMFSDNRLIGWTQHWNPAPWSRPSHDVPTREHPDTTMLHSLQKSHDIDEFW